MTISKHFSNLPEPTKGVIALITAFTLWGLSTLYYHRVRHVPAYEVLAHRSLWTFVVFGLWIAFQGRLKELAFLFRLSNPDKTVQRIIPACLFVSFNWFLFIFAVQSGRAIEASLAYYVFPLMAAATGAVVFKERLYALQYVAMVLAGIAVLILAIGLGAAPWLSLVMAATFIVYGTIKKGLDIGPVISMAAETALLAPIALVYLVGAHMYGWGGSVLQPAGALGTNIPDTLWLLSAGIITGVPLILFSYAARRVSLTVAGLGNFYNASIQLFVSVMIFGETVTRWHKISLPLIWIGIVLFTFSALRGEWQKHKKDAAEL